ncbi:hypothetical protein ACIG63_19150 [Streptomyces antimycoticus]|uniref:hypothetical protein n=1 Tax=Streptomyces antimycoticus TaxID=68175 RepID=UPI0037D77347
MASLRSPQRIAALRFTVPAAVAVAGLAFAWPADAASIQNWPVVLKTLGGRTTMIQRQPGNQVFTIWSTPASANTWNHYTIGLHLSDETKGGRVQLWVNGQRQKFGDGTTRWACRTFDSSNDPK